MLDIWVAARFDLHLSENEIGKLNLKEYDALISRKRIEDNKRRLDSAIVAAAIYNCAPFGDSNRKPVSPLDFVPDWKPKENDLTEMTPEEQKKFLISTFFRER